MKEIMVKDSLSLIWEMEEVDRLRLERLIQNGDPDLVDDVVESLMLLKSTLLKQQLRFVPGGIFQLDDTVISRLTTELYKYCADVFVGNITYQPYVNLNILIFQLGSALERQLYFRAAYHRRMKYFKEFIGKPWTVQSLATIPYTT